SRSWQVGVPLRAAELCFGCKAGGVCRSGIGLFDGFLPLAWTEGWQHAITTPRILPEASGLHKLTPHGPLLRAVVFEVSHRIQRLLIVLAGVFIGQFILYGPSLVGQKVLLPLDILTGEGAYTPRTEETAQVRVKDKFLVDLVLLFEPSRRFAANEIHSG